MTIKTMRIKFLLVLAYVFMAFNTNGMQSMRLYKSNPLSNRSAVATGMPCYQKRDISLWAGMKDCFNFSREKKAYLAFKNTFLNDKFLTEMIQSKGIIQYPKEYSNDYISNKYDDGTYYTTRETPLIFGIKKFGNYNGSSVLFDQKFNKNVLTQFHQQKQDQIAQTQYNLTKSLIDAGANANKQEMYDWRSFHDHSRDASVPHDEYTRINISDGPSFPLKQAVNTLNVGALQALIEAGAPVNITTQKVTMHGLYGHSYSYSRYPLYALKLDFEQFCKTANKEVIERMRPLFDQAYDLLKAAGGKESNEAQQKPYGFDEELESFRRYKQKSEEQASFRRRCKHNNSWNQADDHATYVDEDNKKLFSLLGLSAHNSSKEMVRKAYLEKISPMHPDRFVPGTKEYDRAVELTKTLNALYDAYKQSLKK